MTNHQEITTRQLVDLACEVKNTRGYRSIDFIPNGYSVMENIVQTWERGEHTSANFKRFKRDMAAFIEALRAGKLDYLQLDTFDKHGRALPRLARSGEAGRYGSIDNIKKVLCFLNFKYHAVTALAGMGEHDFLKIHTFRKEVR